MIHKSVYGGSSCIKFTEPHFAGYLGHKIWRHLDERTLVNEDLAIQSWFEMLIEMVCRKT